MATFVLVHGAWHGSWCWKRVRRGLRELGHDVHTPTLTGLGERVHLLSEQVTAETHIADIVNLVQWEELDDVILVAHSYGGFVARHVVDRIPERIAHVVYLDAFVPEHGRSLNEYAGPAAEVFRAGARDAGDGWKIPPVSSAWFSVNAADAAWMDAQCTPQPLVTFKTAAVLEGKGDGVPATYVLAADFGNSPFAPFAEAARARGWPCHGMRGGHDLMLDSPAEVIDLLQQIAA